MIQRDDPRASVDAIRVRSMHKQDIKWSGSFLSCVSYVFSFSSSAEYFKDELRARYSKICSDSCVLSNMVTCLLILFKFLSQKIEKRFDYHVRIRSFYVNKINTDVNLRTARSYLRFAYRNVTWHDSLSLSLL